VRLSARARYALRLMHEVAERGGEGRPVQLTGVARDTRISKRYLEQLAIALKSHGLLRGICGRGGGYRLGRPAAQITVGHILAAVHGPLRLATCVAEPERCLRSDFCACRLVWVMLDTRIAGVLDEFTLADLGSRPRLDELRARIAAGRARPA
jgi:Rrf2 family protein